MADFLSPTADPSILVPWSPVLSPAASTGGGAPETAPTVYLENGRLHSGATVPAGARLVAFEP